MKIKKVRLENFRGFEGVHEFELHSDYINVIIGANGAGKTSIIDAISYPLCQILPMQRIMYETSFLVPDNKIKDITYDKKSFKINIEVINQENTFNITSFFERPYKFEENLNLRYNIILKKYDDKREINFDVFFKWYKEQVNIQNNEKIKTNNLSFEFPSVQIITKATNTFIRNLSDNDFSEITLDKGRYIEELVLFINKINGKKIEFSQLSAGQKTILAIVLELALDSFKFNSDIENPLLTPGIVLIDEIELHLHPKWQTSILQALNKTFPNIQFIVTTHSPLVINHLKNENLILLDDFKITEGINVQSIYGRDVNSIITDFMGASAKPKEVDDLINDIEVLLDEEKPNINLAKEKLNKLKGLTSPNHSEALKLETLITIEED